MLIDASRMRSLLQYISRFVVCLQWVSLAAPIQYASCAPGCKTHDARLDGSRCVLCPALNQRCFSVFFG